MKIRTFSIGLILIIMNIVIIVVFVTQRNKWFIEREKLREKIKEYETFKNYTYHKSEIRGNYIWDTGIIDQKSFNELKKHVQLPKLFFWYDTLNCTKCYNFHVRKIKGKVGKDNTIIIYNGKFKFLKTDFKNFFFVNSAPKVKRYSQIAIFVDSVGRILYADFPSYGLYEQSRAFYQEITKYLNNGHK